MLSLLFFLIMSAEIGEWFKGLCIRQSMLHPLEKRSLGAPDQRLGWQRREGERGQAAEFHQGGVCGKGHRWATTRREMKPGAGSASL
jgi:hypothetical protein